MGTAALRDCFFFLFDATSRPWHKSWCSVVSVPWKVRVLPCINFQLGSSSGRVSGPQFSFSGGASRNGKNIKKNEFCETSERGARILGIPRRPKSAHVAQILSNRLRPAERGSEILGFPAASKIYKRGSQEGRYSRNSFVALDSQAPSWRALLKTVPKPWADLSRRGGNDSWNFPEQQRRVTRNVWRGSSLDRAPETTMPPGKHSQDPASRNINGHRPPSDEDKRSRKS